MRRRRRPTTAMTIGATSKCSSVFRRPLWRDPLRSIGRRRRSVGIHPCREKAVTKLGAHRHRLGLQARRVDGDLVVQCKMLFSGLPSPVLPGTAVGELIMHAAVFDRRFSRAKTMRMISMYSRWRVRGFSYDAPYQPSTTCGPEGPSPMMKRPPDRWSSDMAVIAAMVGARAGKLHDGRAHADLGGLREDPGGRGHRVGAISFRRPTGIEAQTLRFEDEIHGELELATRVVDDESEFHGGPFMRFASAAEPKCAPASARRSLAPRLARCERVRRDTPGRSGKHAGTKRQEPRMARTDAS